MKLKRWIYGILILQCLLVLTIYWAQDILRTDRVAPEIQVEGTVSELSVHDAHTALLQGVTATDDRDGDVTDSLVVEQLRLADREGTVIVTYVAFDSSGNVSKADRQLHFVDYESPRFELTAPLVMELYDYSDLRGRLRVVDAVDGDISHRIHVDNLTGSSAQVVGTYQVQLLVTNSLGDTVVLELPVEICAAGTYAGRLELTDYLIYLPVGSSFDPEQYLQSYTLGREVTDLTAGIPEDAVLEISGNVDTRTPGVYAVSYRFNWGQTGYTKLMVVVEG